MSTIRIEQTALGSLPVSLTNGGTGESLANSDPIDAITGANNPSATNVFATMDDIPSNELTADELAAIQDAASPSALNVFATMGDIVTITTGDLTESTSSVLTIGSGTDAVVGSGTTIQVKQSGVSESGYLSSTDWNTFNNKQEAITEGDITETTSSILTITGGTNAVIGSGTTIEVKQAAAAQAGYLGSADWNIFNNKGQTKGQVYIATTDPITLSGEQTIDGYLTSGSRVLVKNQIDPKENGIYVSSSGAWSRTTDANTGTLLQGAIIGVQSGRMFSGTLYYNTNTTAIEIGTTLITFAKFAEQLSSSVIDDSSIPSTYHVSDALDTLYTTKAVDTAVFHKATAAEISAETQKTAPVGADVLLIEDSEASFAKKYVTLASVWNIGALPNCDDGSIVA